MAVRESRQPGVPPADAGVIGHEEAIGVLAPLAETDAAAACDAGPRLARLARPQCEAAAQQAPPVVVERDAEGLTELAGAVGQLALRCSAREAPGGVHRDVAVHRLEGAQQDRGAASAGFADHVGAGVDSVAPIDVEPFQPDRTWPGCAASGRGAYGSPGRCRRPGRLPPRRSARRARRSERPGAPDTRRAGRVPPPGSCVRRSLRRSGQ